LLYDMRTFSLNRKLKERTEGIKAIDSFLSSPKKGERAETWVSNTKGR
jgi:hypothetical protein